MLRVGLTGGIACGKSAVAEELRRLGVPVLDADQLARDVVEPGQPALQEIVTRFGTGVLDERGRLDRKVLGTVVFSDAKARADLEGITHPRIAMASHAWFMKIAALGEPLAVYEVPILVEAGLVPFFDRVIVVAAQRSTQIARVMARDGVTEAEAEARLAAQMPTEEKVRQAHFVIWNDSSLNDLKEVVRELHQELLALTLDGSDS